MPAPKVKSIGEVAPKWARRAGGAGQEYEAGVKNPAGDWQASSTAAKGNWKQGLDAAAARDGYAKGVAKAGNAGWQRGAVEKGPARFAQGVALAEGDYQAGFAPYLEAISRVDLPPAGPRGSAQNLQRMQQIPQALAALKRR